MNLLGLENEMKQEHLPTGDDDFYIPAERAWPPVEYFGPEIVKSCCGKRMRYVGVNFYESEPDKDLHMWACETCGTISEVPATLTEFGNQTLAARLPKEKPVTEYTRSAGRKK